ncbi:DUF1998 domain-containing protein [Streptomyces aidingensis]|uniref:MrfA-like Zn-binding domain-containing protein n=1 Tax=Streptomyces aidingensis TaxID=910347 RepID=A0A1I1URN1_9ACTN|nr:DUF1998 domain-containing protein [Streptomyces aidingensis]SFD73245.1 protein of unknown function [Streptomyces aidingensis]
MSGGYFRRVGAVRPSHLMFTGGVGALVDLPNFSVMVKGLDHWNYAGVPDQLIEEPRLRRAVNRALGRYGSDQVTELRRAPWIPGTDTDPKGHAARVGVPVSPFPQWLRCTACNELASLGSGKWGFENHNPRRPHEARFFHENCPRKRRGHKPLAVAARFALACLNGHLDEFPYTEYVHEGRACPDTTYPTLRMRDHGGNVAANVTLECLVCKKARRNIRHVLGDKGRAGLPRCRGRHPHFDGVYETCDQQPYLLVVGASNQWFPVTLSALALPDTGTDSLRKLVEDRWPDLEDFENEAEIAMFARKSKHHRYLRDYEPGQVWQAIRAYRAALSGGDGDKDEQPPARPDLLTPEWQVLSAAKAPDPTEDFALVDTSPGEPLTSVFAQVRQVERLREVRALTGFTRLDAPDPENPAQVMRVDLGRRERGWVPASEVRGEGLFLRVDEVLVAQWEQRVASSKALAAHAAAFARFREHRRSERLKGDFDPMQGWPGGRYIALHTLSHLLIRTIAMECGYNAASLAERIYAGDDGERRTGILIYTAVPDAEGTLGGLLSLADQDPATGENRLTRIVRTALHQAGRCSSDPLCGERLPQAPEDFLHGAACHACLFVSETTCERGNRFLDRRFITPLAGDAEPLALIPRFG